MAVYITGDKHGDFLSDHLDYAKVRQFCEDHHTTKEDVMIVLGDHGVRFFPDNDWATLRDMSRLEKMPIRFVLIRGNHDRRVNKNNPNLQTVTLTQKEISGTFYRYEDFPHLLFPKEYGWYSFAGHSTFIICGAYSIDKEYRLMMQTSLPFWFRDEQLSAFERQKAFEKYKAAGKPPASGFLLMSHTCPLQSRPVNALLRQFEDVKEDTTMEQWMDEIADCTVDGVRPWAKWYCGHFHVDETIGNVRFMYHDIIQLEEAP